MLTNQINEEEALCERLQVKVVSLRHDLERVMLTVLEMCQPRGSPRCEVLIRPHTVWNRSPIQSINSIAIYSYIFSLALAVTERERSMYVPFLKVSVSGECLVAGVSRLF